MIACGGSDAHGHTVLDDAERDDLRLAAVARRIEWRDGQPPAAARQLLRAELRGRRDFGLTGLARNELRAELDHGRAFLADLAMGDTRAALFASGQQPLELQSERSAFAQP